MLRSIESGVRLAVVCLFILGASSLGIGINANIVEASEVRVSLGKIPKRSEIGPDGKVQGVYVDLFKKMDAFYADGSFSINVFPFARSINNIQSGQADIHFPMIRPGGGQELPFIWVPEPILNPTFILYSHKDNPLGPEDDLTGKIIETVGGGRTRSYKFDVGIAESPTAGLRKLSLGRIDGYIGEQGITDRVLKAHGFKNIHRELFNIVEMGMAVPKTEAGQELSDRLVSIIKDMKEERQTKLFLDSIYPPYEDWQIY